jgi:predicted amidohydrolase
MVKLSAIQLNAKPSVEQNLQAISKQLEILTKRDKSNDHIVVLPECCLFFGETDKAQLLLAKNCNDPQQPLNSSLQQTLSELAKKFHVYLVAGTIPLLTEQGNKFTNSSCIFNPAGEMMGRYDKIHLFDVNVQDNEKTYLESRYTKAGSEPCVVKTPLANIGLSVCFDIRFPMLYQTLNSLGADIITVPSAFTRVTGKAHWQTLLQARAIENQVYIIAAGQEGIHANGRETWGHSMIISPWGEVLVCLEEGEGIITTDYDGQNTKRIRESMPLKHVEFSNK